MLPPFAVRRAKSRKDALRLLADIDAAVLLAGGTDLLVRMKRGESHPCLIDIAAVKEIQGISEKDSRVEIGAAATHSRICADAVIRQAARSLAGAAAEIGSPQIRNMGTLGGNLANASPCADSIPPLLVHDALLRIDGVSGERMERLDAFITAPYRTTLRGCEMLCAVSLERLDGYREGYRRVAKRAAWAVSRLGIAWAIREEDGRYLDVRLAVGSCTPRPFRAGSVEAFLKGRRKEKEVIEEAVRLCLEEIRIVTGERPSFGFKLPVVRDVLTFILAG